MGHSRLKKRWPLAIALLVLAAVAPPSPPARASNTLEGTWSVSITIPSDPTGAALKTISVTFQVTPMNPPDALVGRMTMTDDSGNVVAGAWRQAAKRMFVAFEMACPGPDSLPCGTLILQGKIKNDRLKNGNVIVMWDTPRSSNPALYRTSNGSFSGQRAVQ